MNNEFVQQALRHGDKGQEWLNSIPQIIRTCEQNWKIKVSSPFHLSYNYVAPATREDGTHVVLKIGFPTDREFQTEVQALKVFNGSGIEQLLAEDTENCTILIEHVLPGIPLSSLDNDEEATRIIAHVMKKLWKPLPPNHPFIPIDNWIREIFDYHNHPGSIPMDLVNKAIELFHELLATSSQPVLVHGDLHQDNVLSSDRDVWLAIDPKGIAAEPVYETAAMIRNPYDKLNKMTDEQLKLLLEKRLSILSEELGFERQRIWKWCFAQTVLSGVWNDSGVKGSQHSVRIAKLLEEIEI